MKNIVALILLVLMVMNEVYSQAWDTNTTWVFETEEYGPPIDGNYLIYKVSYDTIIQNKTFQKILAFQKKVGESELYPLLDFELNMLYEGDRISYFDPCDATIHLVYDFSLVAGDTLTTYCPCQQEVFDVRIDSSDVITQQGIERRRQFTSYINGRSCQMQGMIIEGMGFFDHLLPQSTFADPPKGGNIVCYNDINFSFPENTACNLIVSNEDQRIQETKVYPNPTTGVLYIEGMMRVTYDIFNLHGQSVLKGQRRDGSVDISSLKDGIYFLLVTENDQLYMSRIIKSQ